MDRPTVILLVAFLCLLFPTGSNAQLVSDYVVPKPYQTTGEATLIPQSTGSPFLVVRSGYDGYIPLFEQWYGTYESSLLSVDLNGIPTRVGAFDTSAYSYYGLYGWDELMEYSAVPTVASTGAYVTWYHQRAYWSDVPPPNADRPTVRAARATPSGILPLFSADSSLNPRVALDAAGNAHFAWEQRAPFPYTPYPGWTYDSNYFFATGKIVYHGEASLGPPIVIGEGFHPLIAMGEQDTVHLVWLRADSSNSPAADMMYTRGSNGVFTQAETLRASLPFVDPYSPHQIRERSVLLSLHVGSDGQVRVFWTGPGTGGSFLDQLYILTGSAGGNWLLDSVPQPAVDYVVSPDGIVHALWSLYQGGVYTLQYATSGANPPFSDDRTFRPRNSGGVGKLLRNSNGVFSAVIRDGTFLGYIPDLAAGPDTLLSFGVSGYYPSGNIAALDSEDHMWICYGRTPFGTSPSDTLRLIRFDPIVLSVANGGGLPQRFALHQNYPNPFNPVTTIGYELPEGGSVSMKVYDILGRDVATLVNDDLQPGYHAATFEAKDQASGVYFVRLVATDRQGYVQFAKTIKIVLMK